jgi:hypothetical protein
MITYLGIALLFMGQDALHTSLKKLPYKWFASLVLALLWPITSVLLIFGAIRKIRI